MTIFINNENHQITNYMKRNSLFLATAFLISLAGCKSAPVQEETWISNALDVASCQLKQTAEELTVFVSDYNMGYLLHR